MIDDLADGRIVRVVILYDYKENLYYEGEKDVPAEYEWNDSHPKTIKVLDFDFFEMKVFIRMIKDIVEVIGNDGPDKENSSNRKRSGRESERLDIGDTGSKNGGTGNNSELPRTDDNNNEGNSGVTGGDETGTKTIEGTARRITEKEKEALYRENRNIPIE